jgi:DNA modification methylase/superfamily II DNA or RNA helicase
MARVYHTTLFASIPLPPCAMEAFVIPYHEFRATKQPTVAPVGRTVAPADIHPAAKDHQRAIIAWAVRQGRAAIFADTGLGKTLMLLEWARLISTRAALIIAPLSVARQTVREGERWGVPVRYVRGAGEVDGPGLYVTNYELVQHFDPAAFDAVVLDESSILKALDGKTRQRLTALFAETPYRLCCTATPAPNDIAEIGNHAEFLGILRAVEMKGAYFVHDDDGYRLRGHAKEPFYRWLASWAMSIRRPSDLGFDDTGYILPALTVSPLWVSVDYVPDGQLFFTGLDGIQGRTKVRRSTLADRVVAAAALVNADTETWIVWCGLNEESDALAKAIPGAVVVEGNMSPEEKAARLEAFQDGQHRVLITKGKIAGFGMNFQHCARQVFVGLSDSWELYYQCIRRSWRFGQGREVRAWIVLSEHEEAIYANVMRKEGEAQAMSESLINAVRDYERDALGATPDARAPYVEGETSGEGWRLLLGDSAERLAAIADESVGMSIYSPPFASLYTYSASDRDLGNSRSSAEFFTHYGYIIREILRVTKPGRATCVHVQQIAAMLERDGYIGIKDFRGDVIRAYEANGWIYDGEVCIDKDPQAQAIRTKAKALMFVQLHKDSAWSRPALADYIIKFRKPGTNAEPVIPDISNDEWIEWARPIWYGIKESDTLQYTTARDPEDERHVCPLQLGTIERCVRLWSNRGDLVLSPFAGIGSEGHEALRLGRRFVGIELKPSYYRIAVQNLRRAETRATTPDLFSLLTEEAA